MRMESGVVQTLNSQSLETTIVRLDVTRKERPDSSSESQTTYKHDVLAASIIIGLTAQFVAVIFGLVTAFIPTFLINMLLSSFIGICVGLISYMLMNDSAF